jgi:hypothetical protein
MPSAQKVAISARFHGSPELERSPDSEAWRQALIVETKGMVRVDEPIDADVFAVNSRLACGSSMRPTARSIRAARILP